MKTFLNTISLFMLCLCGSMQAQTGLLSGNLNISTFPSDVGGNRFNVSGTFSDPKGQSFASGIDTGMVMWKGNNLYLIDSILSQSGANITFRVLDVYLTGFIATGTAQVLELTPNLKLPGVSTTGDSNAALATPPDHSALLNYIVARLDSIIGNLPGGGDGDGIYGGSGTVPAGNVVATVTDNFNVTKGNTTFGLNTNWGIFNNYTGFGVNSTFGSFVSKLAIGNGGSSPVAGFTIESATNRFGFIPFTNNSTASLFSHTISAWNGSAVRSEAERVIMGKTTGNTIVKGLSINGDNIFAFSTINLSDSTHYPSTRPSGSAAFWQYNTNGTGEYKTPGAMTVTNPFGGINTLQAALDSAAQAAGGTWLKPELQAGDVTIENGTNTLTFDATPNYSSGEHTILKFLLTDGTDERINRILHAQEIDSSNFFTIQQYDTEYSVGASTQLAIRSGDVSNQITQFFAPGESVLFSIRGKGAEIRLRDSVTTKYVGIKSPSTVTTSYTINMPTGQGGAGQTWINDGSGNMSWGIASSFIGGGGTLSRDTAFSYTTSSTPAQICYTDYSLINGVSTSGCTGGSQDIINNSGAERMMLVNSAGFMVNEGESPNWIEADIYVNGAAAGVRQLIYLPEGGPGSGGTSFSVTGNVTVPDTGRVDVRFRPAVQKGGTSTSVTIEQIFLTANYSF